MSGVAGFLLVGCQTTDSTWTPIAGHGQRISQIDPNTSPFLVSEGDATRVAVELRPVEPGIFELKLVLENQLSNPVAFGPSEIEVEAAGSAIPLVLELEECWQVVERRMQQEMDGLIDNAQQSRNRASSDRQGMLTSSPETHGTGPGSDYRTNRPMNDNIGFGQTEDSIRQGIALVQQRYAREAERLERVYLQEGYLETGGLAEAVVWIAIAEDFMPPLTVYLYVGPDTHSIQFRPN